MKLSYDDQDVARAADALYVEAQREGWGCPPSWGEPSWRAWYRKTVRLVLETALAQQAQPLTNETIYSEAVRIADAVLDVIPMAGARGTIIGGLREIAEWARDRMAQQARCSECGGIGPLCDGLTICVKCFDATQQAQPRCEHGWMGRRASDSKTCGLCPAPQPEPEDAP